MNPFGQNPPCKPRRILSKRIHYFAYGSNLHPLRLQERVPSAALLGWTHLHGWELRFDKRGRTDGQKVGSQAHA
jgi:hypothetical protein